MFIDYAIMKEWHYRVEYTSQGHIVGFKIWVIHSWDNEPLWEDDDMGTPTRDIEKAQVFIEGFVRFDGCTNYTFPSDAMEHTCYRSQLVSVGVLLGRIWDQCVELMGDKASPWISGEKKRVRTDGPFPWEAEDA